MKFSEALWGTGGASGRHGSWCAVPAPARDMTAPYDDANVRGYPAPGDATESIPCPHRLALSW